MYWKPGGKRQKKKPSAATLGWAIPAGQKQTQGALPRHGHGSGAWLPPAALWENPGASPSQQAGKASQKPPELSSGLINPSVLRR